ncbi:glycosyltransferase family 2 protein [Flavobacterium phycosphaerae]|uniref:glycosyltransferase family 2 protein n=1 Tax=Flavobacterium phycosphaerae TaxID=2697515 RepID=UPI001F3300F2|nr:glycosyltransferase family 2 protein [Flavobacterium phycosphaerae]
MKITLNEYITETGEVILYKGTPDFKMLDKLAVGPGDIWHSSFEQGYKNAFMELVYQTATFFWFIQDFDGVDQCISWRINPYQFAVRKSVWETLGGFDSDYENVQLQALDFGYNAVRLQGAVPMYCKGLFDIVEKNKVKFTAKERYVFYVKNFKSTHAFYMLYRKGFWRVAEWNALFYARKNFKITNKTAIVKPRELKPIQGKPTVSYIIPTMMRQDFTLNLLEDLKNQTYLPSQVVVVDATPAKERNESLYNPSDYPFELIIKWQETKGSCRARNEAIELCTSEYIVFGDDDLRVLPDYIENHIRFLQTYHADACNGLDIQANHQQQNLDDLRHKLKNYGPNRYLAGAAQFYNNANNCVKREFVTKLEGNDINYDGGYGEDNDFGLSLTKIGVIVLQNPFSNSLHLKPPVGGYRFWGSQSAVLGKKRKKQPWELDHPVKWIRPVPSPTIMYFSYKHFGKELVNEYRHKYFFLYLFTGSKWSLPMRILRMPYRQIQFNKSIFYAKNLQKLGKRTK